QSRGPLRRVRRQPLPRATTPRSARAAEFLEVRQIARTSCGDLALDEVGLREHGEREGTRSPLDAAAPAGLEVKMGDAGEELDPVGLRTESRHVVRLIQHGSANGLHRKSDISKRCSDGVAGWLVGADPEVDVTRCPRPRVDRDCES
ncbi:MAG: hypothetical protein ACK56I_28015, partial [bacterium]